MTGVHSCVLVGLAPHLPSLWRPSVGPSWASLCSPGIVRLLAQQAALRWLTLSFPSPCCLYFSKEAPGAAVCLRVGTWLPWVGTISGLWASFFPALPILLYLVKSFLNLEQEKTTWPEPKVPVAGRPLLGCWAAPRPEEGAALAPLCLCGSCGHVTGVPGSKVECTGAEGPLGLKSGGACAGLQLL